MQKGRVRGLAQRGSTIAYGSFAIKTMEVGFITSRQIEAARIAINRYMKREGKVWIRIFPDKPITSKPAEVRMGKGKSAPSHWVAPVRPGRIMFEVDGVPLETAQEALRLGAQKLPVKCKLVIRPDYAGS
jgi:large subunit ribosomal protein L16